MSHRWLYLLGLLTPLALRAQAYGVAVSPTPSVVDVAPNTTHPKRFWVKNTGTQFTSYSIADPGCQPTLVNCTFSTFSLQLAAGDSGAVDITYTSGPAGTQGRTSFAAAVSTNLSIRDYAILDVRSTGERVRAVAVSPAPDTIDVAPGSRHVRRFWVKNTGTEFTSYSIMDPACQPQLANCRWSTFTVPLAMGDSAIVDVGFTAGPAGTMGRLSFAAAVNDSQSIRSYGIVDVRSVAGVPSPAGRGATIERDLCLTVAAGQDVAYQCGALRIAHVLPSVRTRNTTRAPRLLYNSAHAHPFVRLAFDLGLGSASLPDSLVAVLRVNGSVRDSVRFLLPQWAVAGTGRVVMRVDAATFTTGVYPYVLELARYVGGVRIAMQGVEGEFAVVNRSRSPFGSGWWLAGLERLYSLADGRKLWVGGDGSTRIFRPGTPTQWVADAVDRTEVVNFANGVYVLALRGGAKVHFDTAGRHVSTTDRLGFVTQFAYDASGTLLQRISIPHWSDAYRFTYASAGADTVLQTVESPGVAGPGGTPRTTVFAPSGGRIAGIVDPDGTSVTFGFDPAVTRRVSARTNRKGVVSAFTFDTLHRLTRSVVDTAGLRITTSFCDGAAAMPSGGTCATGVVRSDSAVTLVDGPRSDVSDVTAFWLDVWGAPVRIRNALGHETTLSRGDGRFPAVVTRLRDALGRVTGLTLDPRGNVAMVTDSSDFQRGAYARTSYAWDQTWDQLTQVTLPEGEVTRFGVDPTTGNRIWQEDGRGAPSRVTFVYDGGAPGSPGARLLRAIVRPGNARDSLAYDAQSNLRASRTPLGAWTTYQNDLLGRVEFVETDISTVGGTRQRRAYTYDRMDRVLTDVSSGPALPPAPAELTTVRFAYDAEGNVDTVFRTPTTPDPSNVGTIVMRRQYDAADRLIREIAADGKVDSTFYDPAGNVNALVTRRGHRITMTYDALNRLLQRTLPSVPYASRNQGVPSLTNIVDVPENRPYPRRALGQADSLSVDGDVQTFTYDPAGNLTFANNADARVARTYLPTGRLATETQRIRTYAGADFSQHVYQLAFEYDRNGRRTRLTHPRQLAPRTAAGGVLDTVAYAYDTQTGALARVTDPLGNAVHFGTDLRGQPDSLRLPGGVTERYTFDDDGRLVLHRVVNNTSAALADRFPDSLFRRDTMTYDARGKMLSARNPFGIRDTLTLSFSGLGFLVTSNYKDYGLNPANHQIMFSSSDTMHYDALGSMTGVRHAESGGSRTMFSGRQGGRNIEHTPALGRVAAIDYGVRVDTLHYNPAGDQEFSTFSTQRQAVNGEFVEDRSSFYGADGRVRAIDRRTAQFGSISGPRTLVFAFEEYRYDALGRRVLVRTRRWCQDGFIVSQASLRWECATQPIRRTVWDGSQELYEIQVPGGDSVPNAELENDTLPIGPQPRDYHGNPIDQNPFWGRVAYTHGLGIDQPLTITRIAHTDHPLGADSLVRWAPFSIVPHWNARGEADLGTTGDGSIAHCAGTGSAKRCASTSWPSGWTAYWQQDFIRGSWHGSLVDQKRDASGLVYRRERYMDPATGRFTQEDPVGLAGGYNLYGFANSDPVNYSDPFGLCPPIESCMRALGDVGVGMTPGVSTVADAATMLTGRNYVTGESEGVGGRVVAAFGLFTPASGGEIRGIGRIVSTLTERFGDEVASFTTKLGATQREWINKNTGMKHILRGPETHDIGGKSVTHWNYEQHVPRGSGRYKQVQDVHLDTNGNPIRP